MDKTIISEIELKTRLLNKTIENYEDRLFAKKREKKMNYWISLIAKWSDTKYAEFLNNPEKCKLIVGYEERVEEARAAHKHLSR